MTIRELIVFCDDCTSTPVGCRKCPIDLTCCQKFYDDWGYFPKDFRPDSLLTFLKEEYLDKEIETE